MVVGLEAKYCLKLSKTLGSHADGGMFLADSVSTGGVAATSNCGGRDAYGGVPEERG